jgi:MFS transporter, UMF1 family
MGIRKQDLKRPALILAWGLYDVANQFFAINIVSLYFILWVTVERATPEKFYSLFYAASLFLVAVSAPVLGAISDLMGKRRAYLAFFTLLSVVFTMLLGLCENVFLALAFFAVANFGCQGAIVFYNAMMLNVAPPNRVGLVSGIGKMLGYGGAILALYLVKPIVLEHGYQATFIPTGILFLVFSLPCILFIKDTNSGKAPPLAYFLKKERILNIFSRLKEIFCDSASFPGLMNFLKAGFLGLCAVQVIIVFMGVYAKKVLGLEEAEIIRLIVISTVFAMAGSIVSGHVSDRIGTDRGLMGIFVLWAISFTLAATLTIKSLYWVVGALVGMSLGSTWVISRAMVIKLVPAARIAEIFAVFNIIAYLAGATGVLFWGLALWALSSFGDAGYRIALFGLNIFIAGGIFFLMRMQKEVKNGRRSRF